jgi:Cu/Zn superoxide dismutase
MREARLLAAGFALVVWLAACGGGGDSAEPPTLELQLSEQSGSGQSGTATLTEVDGDRTRIVIELANPPQTPQPSHVHPGSCDDLGPPVAGLSNVVDGKAETVVDMTLDELRTGKLVVHAHKSAQEYDTSVACVRIPAA